MDKTEVKTILKMVAVLLCMATVMFVLMFAYSSGYKDAQKYEDQHLREEIKDANEKLDAYRAYYMHTENFLDALDSKYDWIDAFDPQEYYEARHIIDTLEGTSNLEYN